jgi:hypothetical protein
MAIGQTQALAYTSRHLLSRGRVMAEERRTVPVGLRLTPSLKATLEEFARTDRRSLASYVQIVLEDHAARRKAENGKPTKRK